MIPAEPVAAATVSGRLIWLNGPYGIGADDLAAYLRDSWRVAVLDGDEIGLVLQRGLPAERDPGDMQDMPVWHRSLLRVSVELACALPPLVVMHGTVYEPATVRVLLDWFASRGIDVLHVVLTADESVLRARILDRFGERDAKRWAIQHLRPAVERLAEVDVAARLDTTGRRLDELAHELLRMVAQKGWLSEDGQWTAAH